MTVNSSIAFDLDVFEEAHAFKITFSNQLTMSVCSACPFGDWCEHRAYVLQNNLEISMLHDWFSLIEETDILVPIFPSKNLYLGASITHAGPNAIRLNDANDSDRFYGVVGRDEGLNAMRNLYFDYVMSLIEMDTPPKCTGSHPIQAQRAEAKARDAGGVKFLAYLVDVSIRGTCEVCSRRENYDDLVPDVPTRTGRPNPFNEPRRT